MDESSLELQTADDELLSLLDVFAKYQQLQEAINGGLKRGYFDLAVAKRTAGYRWISPDMYSGRARAIATVAADEESGTIAYTRRTPSATNNADKSEQSGGLRKRGAKPKMVNNNEKNEKDVRKVSDDPLLWFGMLVPPALKDAQTQFTTTLEQLVRLAVLKQQLDSKLDALNITLP
ncbi:hypothetical protein GGH96_000213 [Coemansia sp. RSA 1972]|nr:hypothetical protein GGH96_000213 [Coemansia sp. RSA 1972]